MGKGAWPIVMCPFSDVINVLGLSLERGLVRWRVTNILLLP
jgi:hypothetical protein